VVLVVSPDHENHNDRLKSTAKGLEQYGSYILSGSTPAAAQKLTVLKKQSRGLCLQSTPHFLSFA
jgi:hypothetical protein